jgi:uncharacterized protein YgiM (DUF1202 family)
MARKRYGGFSDPEIEAVDEVTTEIEEAAEPVTFDDEKTADPIVEPMEPIEAEVGEECELEDVTVPEVTPTVTQETANFPYKIAISINALNVRTGPGSTYQSIRIIKKGSVHKVLEERDGWGRIGENVWINLSNKFVQKV